MAKLLALEISIPLGSREVEARVGLYAKASAVTSEDVDELVARLREALRSSLRPIHALLIVAPSVDDEAMQKLEAKCRELSLKLIVARVPRVIDRIRLAAVGKAVEEFSKGVAEPYKLAMDLSKLSTVIDVDTAEVVLRDVVEGLGLADSVRSIAREPIALTEPILTHPINRYEDLVDGMKWFLYAPWSKASVSEFHSYVSANVMRFHLFRRGRKGLLGLDIESVDKLKDVAAALAKNGLINYDPSTSTVDVTKLSPTEERILKILENVFDGVAHADALRKFFVEASANSDRLWRAILSILELRGLVCVNSDGKCPDAPGKSYVVLLRGERARKCLESWLGEVEKVVSGIRELEPYGYVVTGKDRGYRAFTLSELASLLQELSSKAREIASIDSATAVRIARLARELAEYSQNIILPEVASARSVMEMLRSRIRDYAYSIEEELKNIRSLLESYVSLSPVSISLGLLEDLRKGLERISEIVTMAIPRDRFLEDIERLWRSSRGKSFPFHFAKLGPVYHFNYKLYLIHTELRKLVEIDENGELRPSRALEDARSRIEEIENYVKSAIENVVRIGSTADLAETLSRCETLRGLAEFAKGYTMAKIEVEPIAAASVSELHKVVKRIVDEWVERVESDAKIVADLRRLAREVARLEREVVARCRSIEEKMKTVVDLLNTCPTLFDYSTSCSEELDRVKELISHASEVISKLGSDASGIHSLRDVRDRAASVRDTLSKVISELSEERLESCSKLLKEVERRIERLAANVLTLGELVSRLRIETSIPFKEICAEARAAIARKDYSSACELISKLSRAAEELRKLAIGGGLLNHEELDVYTALEDVRSRVRGNLRLSEAIGILVERLNMPYEKVKRLVISLIDKGVLEVYL
ncbi:MAG: hypothetical protein GXO32_03945 [Crenarchaeota archaeon]|nr:hypothetical protein [Thermoproteota archaeon]